MNLVDLPPNRTVLGPATRQVIIGNLHARRTLPFRAVLRLGLVAENQTRYAGRRPIHMELKLASRAVRFGSVSVTCSERHPPGNDAKEDPRFSLASRLFASRSPGRESGSRPERPSFILDPEVPTELAIGRGNVLVLKAWCFGPSRNIRTLSLIVDRAQVQTRVRRDSRHQLAVIWASVPFSAISRQQDLPIELAVTWRRGPEERISLGRVKLLPDIPACAKPLTIFRHPTSDSPLVAICMTTYNPPGELLRRQIESIRLQTYQNWICVIRDDCSKPSAFDFIASLIEGDNRFHLYRNSRRLDFYHNFEACLTQVPKEADFVALCDQDDCWHNDKLSALLAAFEPETMVAYSDMNIVDSSGQLLIHAAFNNGANNNYTDLTSLMLINTVSGAAAVFRRQVLARALPFPQELEYCAHDQWLASVGLLLGKISYVDRPLYDYVQHEGNVVGYAWRSSVSDNGSRSLRSSRTHLAPPAYPHRLWHRFYFQYVLSIQTAAKVLAVRNKLRASGPAASHKQKTIKRLSNLDAGHVNIAWLWLRGAKAAYTATATMGFERRLSRGLLWLKFSRIWPRSYGLAVIEDG